MEICKFHSLRKDIYSFAFMQGEICSVRFPLSDVETHTTARVRPDLCSSQALLVFAAIAVILSFKSVDFVYPELLTDFVDRFPRNGSVLVTCCL